MWCERISSKTGLCKYSAGNPGSVHGQTVFGTQIISRLPELLERKSAFDYETYEITEKERDVMKLVADGKSNKEIAGEMFLSEGTIRNYISGILDKLNLRDRTQLAVFYLRNCT